MNKSIRFFMLMTIILSTSLSQTNDNRMIITNQTDSDIKVKMQSIYHKRKKDNPAARVTRHDSKTITLSKAQRPYQREILATTDKITGAVTPGLAEIPAMLAANDKGKGEFAYDGCLQFIEITDLTTNKTVKWHRDEKQCTTPNNIDIRKITLDPRSRLYQNDKSRRFAIYNLFKLQPGNIPATTFLD